MSDFEAPTHASALYSLLRSERVCVHRCSRVHEYTRGAQGSAMMNTERLAGVQTAAGVDGTRDTR